MTSAGGPCFVVIVPDALLIVLWVSESDLLSPSLPRYCCCSLWFIALNACNCCHVVCVEVLCCQHMHGFSVDD